MSKVNNMATEEESKMLSLKIIQLKNKSGLTYAKLNASLGSPCKTSTLQIRAAYPKKNISKKLLDKINAAIHKMESEDTQVVLDNLKSAAMDEVRIVMDNYVKNIEEYFSQQRPI